MRAPGLLTLVLVVAACGGGDGDDDDDVDAAPETTDLGGWYTVDGFRSGDCGAPTAVDNPPSHLWLEPFDGIFYLRLCAGTAEADCYATPFYDFITPIDDGWSAAGGSAGFGGSCTLSYQRATAVLAGDQLEARARSVLLIDDRAGEACTLEAAAALTGPCASETEIDATRLPD